MLWRSGLDKMLADKFHIWVGLGGLSLLALVVVRAVVVAMCFRDVVGTETVACEDFPPASRPERINTTAIVAARRNAAGAA